MQEPPDHMLGRRPGQLLLERPVELPRSGAPVPWRHVEPQRFDAPFWPARLPPTGRVLKPGTGGPPGLLGSRLGQ